MKAGYTISVLAHGLALAWALVSFSAQPLEAPPVDPIVADVVTDTEFSQITAGVTTAKQTPTPKPVVDKVADVRDPAPKAPELKVAKQEVLTPTAPPPAPPQPDPKPDPTPEVKPDPKPEAKPEAKPAKPEAPPPAAATPPPPEEPDPAVEAMQREEARKEEARKVEEARKAEEARRREEIKKQREEKRREEQRKREEAKKIEDAHTQSLSRIETALIDKRTPQRQAVAGTMVNPTASLGTTTGTAPQLSQNEQSRLLAEIMRQLYGCWHPPVGLADAKTLVVTVDFSLNRDGSLAGPPVVKPTGSGPLFQTAAESAVRAVRECTAPPVGPMRLPARLYDVENGWRELEVNFDPRNMF